MEYRSLQSEKGQLTLELVVALAVLTISLSALILAIFGGQSVLVDSKESNQALRLARQNLENAYASGQSDFHDLGYASSTQYGFLVERIIEDVDCVTKRVTSRVTWSDVPSRKRTIELIALVTNWREIRDLGDDTGCNVTGDWKNPRTLGSVDLGPGNAATDLDVHNKYVYLTAIASDTKKPDFLIVNATNPQTPLVVGRVDTGPGLNSVDVAGTYAYVANNKTSAQLQILDVTNSGSPTTTASLTLSGVSGSGAVGASVFYNNGKVFIGTLTASGPEFHIVDVSNPQSPAELGSFEVGADVNAVNVVGNTAYLATSDDNKELRILDISNPSNISEIGSFDAPGSGDGKSIYVAGTKVYLGRTTGSGNELYILNVFNPAAVQVLGTQFIGSDVTGIVARAPLVFLGDTDSNKEFQVWNVANPASIQFWSSFNFPQVASGVDYEDNLVYVSVRSNDALRIITSQ